MAFSIDIILKTYQHSNKVLFSKGSEVTPRLSSYLFLLFIDWAEKGIAFPFSFNKFNEISIDSKLTHKAYP
jgi:hypothetical protein